MEIKKSESLVADSWARVLLKLPRLRDLKLWLKKCQMILLTRGLQSIDSHLPSLLRKEQSPSSREKFAADCQEQHNLTNSPIAT